MRSVESGRFAVEINLRLPAWNVLYRGGTLDILTVAALLSSLYREALVGQRNLLVEVCQ